MNKPPNIRIVVPEAVVVKPCLRVMPLPLKADALVGRLAPDAGVVDRFRCGFVGLLGVFQLSPLLHVARVVGHPLGHVIGSSRLRPRMPELISRRIRTLDVRAGPAASAFEVLDLAPGPVVSAPDELALLIGQLPGRAQMVAVVVQDAAGFWGGFLARVLKLLGLAAQPGQMLVDLPRRDAAPRLGLQARKVIGLFLIIFKV